MNAVMVSTLAFIAGVKDRLTGEEKGATAVEYGIMVALIAVAIISAVGLFGTQLSKVFTDMTTTIGGTAPKP